jgi:hypothetical protein
MHITDSSLTLSASHRLETEVTRRAAADSTDGPSFRALFVESLNNAIAAQPEAATTEEPQEDPALALDRAFQSLIRALFGDAACSGDNTETAALAAEAQAGSPRRMGQIAQLELVHTREQESCSFSASGNICLADGSTRQFDVDYELERSEESTTLSYGTRLMDPLVLDFAAPTGALGAQSVAFDLDADGQAENMRMPDESAALLFLDRNGNGVADDGSELLGPRSGNGFGELAQLDADGNRWIDAGDAAYAELKLWSVDADGNQRVQTLAEAGVGALATAYEDTPYTIKEDGQVLGQMRGSSVWLGEEGGAGIVRQIDIATDTRTA